MGAAEAKQAILENRTALGIEFGSTRIKAVLVDGNNMPIASGGHEWENRYENGVWTYSLEDIWSGIQDCYQQMVKDVKEKYGIELTRVGAIGISAMMHGYMPFDKAGNLLVPFRTWRNNITGEASRKLSELFQYNIPQRWSIAHLYQAILNGEPHVKDIDYIATLEAYVHWKLTGQRVLGIGDVARRTTTRPWCSSLMSWFLLTFSHGSFVKFCLSVWLPVKMQDALQKRELNCWM